MIIIENSFCVSITRKAVLGDVTAEITLIGNQCVPCLVLQRQNHSLPRLCNLQPPNATTESVDCKKPGTALPHLKLHMLSSRSHHFTRTLGSRRIGHYDVSEALTAREGPGDYEKALEWSHMHWEEANTAVLSYIHV